MFKIAFIGQKGIPVSQGGVERHVEELSIRLARNGHEVFVYTRPHWVPAEYKKYEEVNLISLPSLRTKNLEAISHTFLATCHAILKLKVDIVHYQGVGPSLLAWLPKLLSRRVKVVATIHSADWEHQKWSWFAQMMLKLGAKLGCQLSDETIAVARNLQKYCLAKHKKDVIYIPNGVSQPLPVDKSAKAILEHLQLQPHKYLLIVTRLVKHKGIHYLIEAFKNIKSKAANKEKLDDPVKSSSRFHWDSDHGVDFKLVIVGSTAFTQDYQNYLHRLIRDRSDIIFTGIQTGPNLAALFRNAYLYVQPSISEGLSIAVLEAMSYGKAVLVSDIEENLELIAGNAETGAVGFDFQNKNVLDLARKLKILMSEPKLVRKVGQKAKSYVKLYYNWEEIVERTERVYKNVVLVKDKMPSKFRLALAKYIF